MHAPRAVAVAVVALLVLTIFAIVPGVHAAPAAAPAAVRPAAGFDSITPTDSNGFTDLQFETGAFNGNVYFYAFDNGGDTSAVVQINDQNASRDGVSNPVASFTVNFGTSTSNSSYLWGIYYKIPYDLVYGGWWNITISAASAGFASTPFYVDTYYVQAFSDHQAYTPSAKATVYYRIVSTVNDTPYTHASSLTVTGSYTANNFSTVPIPGAPLSFPVSAPFSSFNLTIPFDAYDYQVITLEIYANTTNGNSETTGADLAIGYLGTPDVTLSNCAPPCFSSGYYVAGAPIYVTVQEYIYSPFGGYPAAGELIGFSFYNNVARVSPLGAPTGTIATNSSGGVSILFIASTANFTTTSWNSVNVTMTDRYNSSYHLYSNTTFYLSLYHSSAVVQVVLGSSQYYGGDTVTVTWTIGGATNAGSGWTANFWVAIGANQILGGGILSGSGSSGTFSFVLPVSYSGLLEVAVEANNATATAYGFEQVSVLQPALTVQASEVYYSPGDTITVAVGTAGQVFQGSTIYEAVYDIFGDPVMNGTVSGGSFQIHVPTVDDSIGYDVSVWATSPTVGVIAAQSIQLNEFVGLTLSAGVATPSSYTDGSYQGGQTIQLSYALTPHGAVSLPKTFYLAIYAATNPSGSILTQVTRASGTVSYTIPAGTPSGVQVFNVIAEIPGCSPTCSVFSVFVISVNQNPSVMQLELPAGSGITVGWVVLLVIVIVVALAILLMMRRRGRPMMMRAERPGGTAPASPPPAAWSEPTHETGTGTPPPPGAA